MHFGRFDTSPKYFSFSQFQIRNVTSQIVTWHLSERNVGDRLELDLGNVGSVGRYILNRDIRERLKNVWTLNEEVNKISFTVKVG